jgi:transposase, IS30 family
MKKKSSFKHIDYEERVKIDLLRKEGKSIRYIAKVLGRSPNTVSYELNNNKVKEEYIAKKANHKAYVKRYLSKRDCMKVAMNKDLSNYVYDKLDKGWSPEQIAGRSSKEGVLVSTKAIYKYVYSRCLENYLFWHKNKKKPRAWKKIKYLEDERKLIEDRVQIQGLGHFEMDFIVSSHNSTCLLVIVDKVSRKVIIEKVYRRDRCSISMTLQKHLRGAKSITTDNDIAFTNWRELEVLLDTKIYFTHPYCSWEKGLVENTNRWIRVSFPKKTDFNLITETQVKQTEYYLNNIPRKIISFDTANELELKMRVS